MGERGESTLNAAETRVVHLVGQVTDTVFSFLGPATAALAEEGVEQTVVLLDYPEHRHFLPRFHASVRLVLSPADVGPLTRLRGLFAAFIETARSEGATIAHLHGFVPSLLAFYASTFHGMSLLLYYSPHGSKSLTSFKLPGSLLLNLLRPLSGAKGQRVIANTGADARRLSTVPHQSIDLIESPVDDEFFDSVRVPARRPLIVTGSRAVNALGAALFAQCAVLLGDQVGGLSFNWIGKADDESTARLRAANVGIFDLQDATDRAAHVAAGWVYVAPPGGLGFPVYLAEAMAVGLPIVAWDTPYHRDLIIDGVNGFLSSDLEQVFTRIAQLLASPALCELLGQSAKEEARLRFDGNKFRESLLTAYGEGISSQY